MRDRTLIGSSTFLAALMMAAAASAASRPAREAREEAPEPEIAPEPSQPMTRQQRRYLERQAAKAARRKA